MLFMSTCNSSSPTDMISVLPAQTPILKSEFERLAARQPMEMLSMKR